MAEMTARRALAQMRTVIVAYATGVLMLPGFVAGLVWFRTVHGLGVARRALDRLDDRVIDILDEADARRKIREAKASGPSAPVEGG